jgi:hypothetical protein
VSNTSQSPRVAANPIFRGRFATELNRFSRHKQKLLDALAEGHRRGPTLGAFDTEQAWNELLRVTRFHFRSQEAAKKEMAPRAYFKQLTKFAEYMGKAQVLVPNGAYGDVGSYIFWTWSREARKRGMSPTVTDFNRLFAILPELEMAARKAAARERAKPGRPRGPSILPSSEVLTGLAAAYRRCTGLKPGAGRGPFARFAVKCLFALGRSGIKEDHLISAIKVARHQAASIFANREWGPSPFA